MSITVQNLEFMQGETWKIPFDCTDADGEVLPLTGATVRWRVASRTGILLDANSGGGAPEIVITTAADGLGVITIPKEATAAIAAGLYEHELRVVDAEGGASTQAIGTVNVRASLF